MNPCIRWCWLVGVILSVIACAGSKQGQGPSRTTPPARPLPSTDREKLAADERAPEGSMAEEDDPRRILERAQRQYDLARAAAEQKDIGAAKTAIDEALRLMVAISAVEDSDLALPKESLLKQLSKLIVAIHEGRIGGGTKGVIAFTFNNRVEREIKRFTGRERRGLVEAYARSGLYRQVIQQELAARGLPDALLWLPVVESGFTPKARSQAQAVGLWQFIMATGQRYGLKRDAWTDDRMDPDKATVAAVEHLSDLYDVFGDWLLAIAAYNCGEERVLRAINRRSTYDFWQLDLPRETEQYVPRFLAVASIIANPDQYGVSLPTPRSSSPFDELLIEKSIALADAARVLGVPPEHLKALNPSLRSDVTPPAGYRLRVPAGLGDALLASLGTIPEAKHIPAVEPRRYTVRRGDTLSGIAQKFGTTVAALKKANRLRGNNLRAGQSLDIPGLVEEMPVAAQASTPAKPAPGARNGGKKETAEPAVQALTPVKPAAVAAQNDSLSKPVSSAPSRSYKVRRGDTLSGIAQKFGTTVIALKQANRLKNNLVAAGRVLTIPDTGAGEQVAAVQPAFERPEPAPAVAPSAPSDSLAHGLFPTTHAVKPGDTIWSIARQYGLTVPELMDLNGLKRGAMLQRGQVLRVVPEDARTIYYTVAPGDTLYSISKAHAVLVRSLMEWNQLGSFEIKTGQRLKIVLSQ